MANKKMTRKEAAAEAVRLFGEGTFLRMTTGGGQSGGGSWMRKEIRDSEWNLLGECPGGPWEWAFADAAARAAAAAK